MVGKGNKIVFNAEQMQILCDSWFKRVWSSVHYPKVERVTHDNKTGLYHIHFKDEKEQKELV